MERNIIILDGYSTIGELKKILFDISDDWDLFECRSDSDPDCSILIACAPKLREFIDENEFDIFDTLSSFTNKVQLSLEVTKDVYEFYIYGEISETMFDNYLPSGTQYSIELEIFHRLNVGTGKQWISLSDLQGYFDVYEAEEILEIVKIGN